MCPTSRCFDTTDAEYQNLSIKINEPILLSDIDNECYDGVQKN